VSLLKFTDYLTTLPSFQCNDGHSSDDDGDDDGSDDPDWHYSESEDIGSSQGDELNDDPADVELTSESSDYIHQGKFVVFESCLNCS